MNNLNKWYLNLRNGLISFSLLFGLPFIGGYAVIVLSTLLGCEFSAADPANCTVLGVDFGDRLYGYAVPMFGSVLTPIAFYYAFGDFALYWFLIVVLLKAYLEVKRRSSKSGL